MDTKLSFRSAINKGQATAALSALGHMNIVSSINNNWDLASKINPEHFDYIKLNRQCQCFSTHILSIPLDAYEIFVVIDQQTDYFEVFYPNHSLCMVSADNFTSLDDGSSFGLLLPSYLKIECNGDYFNYTVNSKLIPVPYEFFEVLHVLHDKIKLL